MSLSKIQKEVLVTTLSIHPNAEPTRARNGRVKSWEECFIDEPKMGVMTFWYNLGENTFLVQFNPNAKHFVLFDSGLPVNEHLEPNVQNIEIYLHDKEVA